MADFIPRDSFAVPSFLPKTYFLGHHSAASNKIKSILNIVSLVLECRDFRLPLSTHNPVIERIMAGRERLIVYTKADLGSDSRGVKKKLRSMHGDRVVFWDMFRPQTTQVLLDKIRHVAQAQYSLAPLEALVVGMPNVGKSTLINALRDVSMPERKGTKVAKTGDQAGVTRSVGTSIRVVESLGKDGAGAGAGVYIRDTPGIFQPYVEDGETMIKVALTHGIKKGLIPEEILADYLLYRMNLWDPALYSRYCAPTNDIDEFLAAVARREGKLKSGGLPCLQQAAARILTRWRGGCLGRYVLDGLEDEDVRAHELLVQEPPLSLNHAKKMHKEQRKRDRDGA